MVSAASASGKKEDTLYLDPHQKASFTTNGLHLAGSPALAVYHPDDSQSVDPRLAQSKQLITGHLTKTVADNAEEAAAWRDGLLIFRSATLQEVMESLSRKYNIRIKSDSSLWNRQVTATLGGNLSADQALLEITRQLKRKVKGDHRGIEQSLQYRKEKDSVYYVE